MRTTLITVAAAAALFAGCGDDDATEADGGTTKSAAAATPTPGAQLPPDLVGTWTTRLKVSEIESATNEFIGASPRWELNFETSGGIDDGPIFVLSNPEMGPVASATPSVEGDRITVHDPSDDCDGTAGIKHFMTYAIEGEQLELTYEGNSCKAEPGPIEDVLFSKPWKRQ